MSARIRGDWIAAASLGAHRYILAASTVACACLIQQDPGWESPGATQNSAGTQTSTTTGGVTETGPGETTETGTGTDSGTETGPVDVETCNGIDDDQDGLVDEVSDENTMCDGCILEQFTDHAYWFCEGPSTWAEARAHCLELGGDLVSVRDEAENAFIASHHPAEGGSSTPEIWIGLNDILEEDTFVWADGAQSDFTAWDASEPNNAMANEDCAQAWESPPGTWADRVCELTAGYACWGEHP